MTQMLLFDCPANSAVPVVTPSRQTVSPAGQTHDAEPSVTGSRSAALPLSDSLPLYDPQQGELHRIGDLAQLVLARYELVHRRRAARRRQACAAR